MPKTNQGNNILLAVTGSIAAYKSAELARLLISRGYNVRCAMTPSAEEFITPLTLETITASPVMTDLWKNRHSYGVEHIELADWADLILIAPATADIIAKITYGFADSALTATILASRAPLLVAPAMNVNMYEHPKTKENISSLKARGVCFVDPEEGDLACGWVGKGRFASLEEIYNQTTKILSIQDLAGKRVLISTGPTREPIDAVRFLSNRSSGKMGIALANEAYYRGAEVTLVHGPVNEQYLQNAADEIRKIPVTTAEEMQMAMLDLTYKDTFSFPHIVIMAAAVSDYRPKSAVKGKLKKNIKDKSLEMDLNEDILKLLGEKKSNNQPFLVGFAVETGEIDDLLKELERKLKSKNIDLMVGNFAQDAFGLDTNRVWLLDKDGRRDEITTSEKTHIASKILDAVIRY